MLNVFAVLKSVIYFKFIAKISIKNKFKLYLLVLNLLQKVRLKIKQDHNYCF